MVRWTARIAGTLMVFFTLFMFVGEIMESARRNEVPPLASFTPLMVIIIVIWGTALAGLPIALLKEGLGGIISLRCFMLTFILNLFNTEASMRGNAFPVFLFFSLPSILYFLYWKLNKDESGKADVSKAGKPE